MQQEEDAMREYEAEAEMLRIQIEKEGMPLAFRRSS